MPRKRLDYRDRRARSRSSLLRHQKIQALKDLPTLKDTPAQKREVRTRFERVAASCCAPCRRAGMLRAPPRCARRAPARTRCASAALEAAAHSLLRPFSRVRRARAISKSSPHSLALAPAFAPRRIAAHRLPLPSSPAAPPPPANSNCSSRSCSCAPSFSTLTT